MRWCGSRNRPRTTAACRCPKWNPRRSTAPPRLLNDLTLEAAGQHTAQVQVLRHALAKFDDGSYGLCEECGQPIGVSRLLARPEARLCIACQTRAEQR
jgi:DnaK suppressor protein